MGPSRPGTRRPKVGSGPGSDKGSGGTPLRGATGGRAASAPGPPACGSHVGADGDAWEPRNGWGRSKRAAIRKPPARPRYRGHRYAAGRPPVPDVDKRTAGPLRCGPDAIVSIGHGERPRRVRPPAGREARCRSRWRSPATADSRPPCRRGRAAGRARCGPRPCRPAPRLPRLRHRRGPRTSRSRREDHGTKPPPRRAFPVGTTGRRRLAGALTRIDARPAGSHPVPARPSGAASGRPARPARPVSSCGAGVRPHP